MTRSQDEEEASRALPGAGPPPDSRWPTERAPDDGGSSPHPHAAPAALQAAGLSEEEGEKTAADELGSGKRKLFRADRFLCIFESNRCKHSVVLMF